MKILVTGCNGQVGWELVRCLQPLGEVVAVDRRQMDLSDLDGIRTTLKNIVPDVIVNAAAYTAVDKAEDNEVEANLINGQAPGVLATEAKQMGALLIHYSTDYIFDGKKSSPYTEDDTPNPINAYGRSKLMGEQAIQAVDVDYIILRTSWVYAARGANFLQTVLSLAQERDELSVVDNQIGAPTWARLIAESTAHVIRQSQTERSNGSFQSNLYHLTAAGETSWFGFAQAIVEQARRMPDHSLMLNEIRPIPTEDYPTPALRPMNSCLATAALEKHLRLRMPSWSTALQLCLAEYR
ncbi:MAG TPA: dTDP-4-dehydrorhamnose reductase [Gammaproteobacteria bacterium]|nr:dTDP-4-dehydrorhamnose reductase [Gammaproteobacteria bacterium]